MSRIMWGIDNLAEKSFDKRKYNKKPLETMNAFEKLELIKVYSIYLSNFNFLFFLN